jgi:flagellar hook-associated protein 1 FlgK
MGGLTTALLAATSGLRAAQTGIDLVSRNVANASTPGYTRKTVPQTPLIVGGEGQGVQLGMIQRQVNERLQVEVRVGISETESLAVQDDFLSRFELAFGKPGDNTTVSAAIHALSDAFRQLGTNPDVITTQTTVVSKAEVLANNLNTLADRVQGLRTEAEDQIKTSVENINAKLEAIDDLNTQIAQAKSLGQATPDLEDRRDVFLDELAKEIDISYYKRSNGEIWIQTKGGAALLDVAVHPVTFNNTPIVTPLQSYPLGLDGIEIDGQDITTSLSGGRLRGLFDLRDTILPQAQLQLDTLAANLTTTLTGEDLVLFNDNGVAFNVANTTGYANRISINQTVKDNPWRTRDGTTVAVPNTNTGDATIPLAIVDMFESLQTFPGTTGLGTSFTFEGFGAAFVAFQGTQRANMNDAMTNKSVLTESLQTRLSNDSGVNVDRELALMIELQNSYGANARMVQAVKEMFDQLLSIV